MKYVINKSFKTSVERSKRVMEVAEAFGLGLEDKEFTLYDNLELEINQGDIVYITGESGSGKSVLLRELNDQMQPLSPSNIDLVKFKDKPLIDQLGESDNDAVRLLSRAGINDAYLLIRKPQQLSDGQLYRLKIAKLMDTKSKVWIADEFGAVLDRDTAKAVAVNLRKQAKEAGATVIVATTHKDLRDELAPNLYIDKRFKAKIKIEIGD